MRANAKHAKLTNALIRELNEACRQMRDRSECRDDDECFGIGWCTNVWDACGITANGKGEHMETKWWQEENYKKQKRLIYGADELLITARYRNWRTWNNPKGYLQDIRDFITELEQVRDWDICDFPEIDFERVTIYKVSHPIAVLEGIASDIESYIFTHDDDEYERAILSHRRKLKRIVDDMKGLYPPE